MGIIITNEVEQTDEWRDRHMDRQRQDRTGILVTKIRCDNVPQIRVVPFTPPSTVSGRVGCTNPVDSPSSTSLDTDMGMCRTCVRPLDRLL